MHRIAPVVLVLSFASLPARADNYPRQPGVDAEHYTFRLTLSRDSETIQGETTANFRFVESGVTRIFLDLASVKEGKGMTVSGVNDAAGPISFQHREDRLEITLPAAPAAGARRAFTIRYAGVAANGLHFSKNRFGARTIFSWNWPTFAREWLPVIDHPSDKATSEFLVTAPVQYQVVANGALVEVRDLDGGLRLTHWKESVPIASWLNNIGVAEFAMRRFASVRGVPLETWVFPGDRDNGIGTFEGPMRQAIDFFSEYIGPYPYEKLASVQVNGMSGGMEHASEVFYGERSVTGQPAFSLVAHEVSHQWWGDSVTEKDWDDAWLSEGFATYFAALAQEHYFGRDAFAETMSRSRSAILQMEKKSPTPVIHENLPEIRGGRAPIGLVYQKGGWVLHMLRDTIGPDKFREGLREYYRRHRDSNASTADLEQVMEEISGENLSWFFSQWLRRGVSPQIEATWTYDAPNKKVAVALAQKQPGDLFRVPLTIAVKATGSSTKMERLLLTERTAHVDISFEKEPENVILDPMVTVLMDARIAAAK